MYASLDVGVSMFLLIFRIVSEGGLFWVSLGIISFYKDFLESLYQLLGGRVSITGKT